MYPALASRRAPAPRPCSRRPCAEACPPAACPGAETPPDAVRISVKESRNQRPGLMNLPMFKTPLPPGWQRTCPRLQPSNFGLKSRRDLPGIDDLKAAGLLDPVDVALERLGLDRDEEVELESGDEEA